jgi:hypothetical protein
MVPQCDQPVFQGSNQLTGLPLVMVRQLAGSGVAVGTGVRAPVPIRATGASAL